MPEKNKYVLVTGYLGGYLGDTGLEMFVAEYNGEFWASHWCDECRHIKSVEYWMSLDEIPAPPKPG